MAAKIGSVSIRRPLLAALLFGVTLLTSAAAMAQAPAPPEIPFDSEPNFLKLPPDLYLGEIAGVAVGPTGHIVVFSRGNSTGPAYGAAAAQLLEFDHDGRFIREIGHNLYAWSFAHAVRFDPQGNLWAADKGSDMVIRFDPQGRVTWVFGRKPEASDESAHPLEHPKPPLPPVPGMFRQVTDMAWDSKGDTFISDGYINSRVAKIGPDGQWIGSFGEPGSGPGQFNTLHSIAIDRQDRIYVADRGNGRIQVFDTAGKLLKIITIDVPAPPDAPAAIGAKPETGETGGYGGATKTMHPGAPWAVCINPGPTQYLFVADAYPGRIYKLTLDGKVLGWLGGSGKQLKQFGWIHELACPTETELYTAELLNWRVQKLTLYPAAHNSAEGSSRGHRPPAYPVAADVATQAPALYADGAHRIEMQDNTGVEQLREAANEGYAPAEFYLAKLYEDGQAGLPNDLIEARRWTEKAAKEGDRKAMHNLALYYFEGKGGEKNRTEAAQWFRRAAALGLVDSQYNLGRLYEEGLGVGMNRAEAYKWYLIAARSGDAASRNSAKRIKDQVSPEDQNAAESAARDFHAQDDAVADDIAPVVR